MRRGNLSNAAGPERKVLDEEQHSKNKIKINKYENIGQTNLLKKSHSRSKNIFLSVKTLVKKKKGVKTYLMQLIRKNKCKLQEYIFRRES